MVLVFAIGFLLFSGNTVFYVTETLGYAVCLDISMVLKRFQNIIFDSVFQIKLVGITKTSQFGNHFQMDFGFAGRDACGYHLRCL